MEIIKKVMVSACLIGIPCRYNGRTAEDIFLKQLFNEIGILVMPFCPELLGGLKTPRAPAERRGEKVINQNGSDLTESFKLGAFKSVMLAKHCGVTLAIMKNYSPSCGRGLIYDGSFTGKLVSGDGVTTQALRKAGVDVVAANEAMNIISYLQCL